MFISIYEDNIATKHVQVLVKCLEDDGVCIIPTDTLYSFVCSIDSHKAAKRLADLKGKKLEKSTFSILCSSLSMASMYVKPLSNKQFSFIKSLETGGFTFVLNASGLIPKIFQTKKRTIGIRISQNNIVNSIINYLSKPLLVTSVPKDKDGETITNAELLYELYGNMTDITVESSNVRNIPSTVLDMTDGDNYKIIREGLGVIKL